jgi:hypothetical protein
VNFLHGSAVSEIHQLKSTHGVLSCSCLSRPTFTGREGRGSKVSGLVDGGPARLVLTALISEASEQRYDFALRWYIVFTI